MPIALSDGLSNLDRALLGALPEAAGEPVPGRSFGRRSATVVRAVLGLAHEPSVEEALIGASAPRTADETRALEAYLALVRLASPWATRYPLVTGQGNLGTARGDPPADAPYTEVRRSLFAEAVLDLDTATSRVPLALVEGELREDGVLVPSHRVQDVVAATRALLADPGLDDEALAGHLGGPDLATGGVIRDGPWRAGLYRGDPTALLVHGRAVVEPFYGGEALVVRELPLGVPVDRFVAEVDDGVRRGRVPGVANVLDVSDRGGAKVALPLAGGADPDATRAFLAAETSFARTFPVRLDLEHGGRVATWSARGLLARWIEVRTEALRAAGIGDPIGRIRADLDAIAGRFGDARRTAIDA